MLVSACNGADELCIFEQWVMPGAGAPTHSHPVEEVLTVLSGVAEMWIDDERQAIEVGHSLIVPAHKKHGFLNAGTTVLHVHAVLASRSFDATVGSSSEPVQRWRQGR